jgi:FAD:protein FMN transferase
MPAVHKFSHEAMATIFEVQIAGQDESYARQVANAVFVEIDHVEGLLSRFDPRSDIAQISRLAPGQSVRVSYEVMECLQLALKVHRATGGVFDPAFRTRRPDGRSGMDDLLLYTGEFGDVAAAPLELAVGRRPLQAGADPYRLELDLGAIGKGYALDRVTEVLSDWSVESALLNAGTSTVLALAPPPDATGWQVGVAGVWGNSIDMDATMLAHGALSGSGIEVKGEHVTDPRTGGPPSQHQAAWVKCPSAGLADALSTAFMLMSREDVEAFCGEHTEVAAILVPRDGSEKPHVIGEWEAA